LNEQRVLLVCYAIEPGRGSEQGSGYNFSRELASLDVRLTLVTRRNNLPALEGDPAFSDVTLIGYDPPRLLTFWKRGGRGILAYYYLWQLGVGRLVRRLHGTRPFDVVHQYNFHTDWAPHFLVAPGARIVWGPICHQPRLPRYFTERFGRTAAVKEWAKWLAKQWFWRCDPNVRRAASRTDVILYANDQVAPPFCHSGRLMHQTFGGAAFLDEAAFAQEHRGADGLALLHVGRSVEIKGAQLAIEALATYLAEGGRARLTVIGEGPRRHELEHLARDLGVSGHVTFLDWMSQPELTTHYLSADAFLYPSLGNQDTVVAEALAAGLPVICPEGHGSHAMAADAALTVDASSKRSFIDGVCAHLRDLSMEASDGSAVERRRQASRDRARVISWRHTAEAVRRRYA
jgi:glycosyltransferase involved in cell wall biosynthesis